MEEDQYLTISAKSTGLYKEKGSRFIALACPVETLEEVKERLENIRKEYHDARHHCYAYKLGKENPEYRMNDDGEPSGTAGKPIYGQIESFGLTNVLIVVVRYFGGIKLGTGGLIQAYRTAARDALQQANVISKTLMMTMTLRFPYIAINEVMRIIKEEDLGIVSQDFSMEARMELRIRKGRFAAVRERLSTISGLVHY